MTIRRSAPSPRTAGVDSALVHHYFGTKAQLFAAAIDIPIDPMTVLGPLRETPVEELGLTLPSLLLPLWDSELGAGLIATLRSLLAGADVSLVRSFVQDVIAVRGRPSGRQSAGYRAAPGAVRGVAIGRAW